MGEMIFCLLTIILLILIERYVNRSDTKASNKDTTLSDLDENGQQKKFFKSADLMKQTTNRSMTVKIKTMKTADLDIQDENAGEFLKTMMEDNGLGGDVKQNRTKITNQQKCKYFMHMTILVGLHVFCFWFIPITGNIKLYGDP